MTLVSFLAWLLLAAEPSDRITVSTVPCQTADDCWLDGGGKPIPRPKGKRHAKQPRGDCGKYHQWLRNRLRCENQVCVSEVIGDRC